MLTRRVPGAARASPTAAGFAIRAQASYESRPRGERQSRSRWREQPLVRAMEAGHSAVSLPLGRGVGPPARRIEVDFAITSAITLSPA